MNPKILIILLCPVFLFSCSDPVVINLPDDQHLEDSHAGWWVNQLQVEYSDKYQCAAYDIYAHLKKYGEVIDIYKVKGDWTITVYKIPGKTKKKLIIHVALHSDGGINIQYNYPPPGVPYEYLIPNDYQRIESDVGQVPRAIIYSARDHVRLSLHGTNKFCTDSLIRCTN